MTFKDFSGSKRLLDRSQYFDKLEGIKISAMLPRSWKKSYKNGIVIPVKMRRCNECKNKILCTTCNNQVNENKEFEANLNLLKRKALNQFGYVLPYFMEYDDLFVINYLNRSSVLKCFLLKRIFKINSSSINEWYNERKSVNHY